jgi:uncharacterized protein (TIGR02466 family)
MTRPQVNITPAFASPIAYAELANSAALNAELEALILSRETELYRNPHPTHIPQREMFESDFDFFRWKEPCVQALRSFVMESIGEVVMQLSGYSPEDLAGMRAQNHAWFHVTRHGGSFVAHNHPMASWSAVYCVRGGEDVPERVDSGALRFLDHRPGSNMYLDPANVKLKRPFNFGHIAVKLSPGQMVVFPSYLVHEVATFLGRDTRITVAVNCWFALRETPAVPGAAAG